MAGFVSAATLAHAAFVLYAALIALGGGVAATARNLTRAMAGLLLAMFGVAGLYLLLLAEFVALMQILIYAGAIGVLIFFALMLTNATRGGEAAGCDRRGRLRAALCAAPVTLLLLILLGVYGEPGFAHPKNASAAAIGEALLGPYVLPFELISVTLLASAIGAVLLTLEMRGKR